MILKNSNRTLTVTGTQFDDFMEPSKSTSKSAGGVYKDQSSGMRFTATEGLRITQAELKTLTILVAENLQVFYTPSALPDYIDSTFFPMPVTLSVPDKRRHVGGGEKKYYVTVKIRSSELIPAST